MHERTVKPYLPLRKVVGRDLQQLRQQTGKSQQEIAKRLRITQPSVSKIESGAANLTLATIQMYSEALGFRVRVSWVPIND